MFTSTLSPQTLYLLNHRLKTVVVTYSFRDKISLLMAVTGPAAWNSLCDELREPSLAADSFRQLLKTRLFAEY